MAVGRRDGRPNRPQRGKGLATRTGVLALLALSAGAGCGQAMLRPPGVSEAHGQAVDPMTGPRLSWDAAGGRPQPAPGTAGRATDPSLSNSDLFHEVVPRDRLNAGLASVGFHGSVTPHSTWNGWKLPQAKGPDAVPATDTVASTDLTPPASLPADPLLAACAETKIAPPKAVAGGPPAGETNTGLESLIEACKATKIAPPVVKASGVAKFDPAEPTPAADAPEPQAPTPVGVVELPSLADQDEKPEEVPVPTPGPSPTAPIVDPLKAAAEATKIPLPVSADAQPRSLREASEAAKIPLPVTQSAP